MPNFIKVRPVGAESLHADAPKNRRKLNYWYRYISVLISLDDRQNQHKIDLNFLDILATMARSNALGRFSLSPCLARLWRPHSTHSTCAKLVQTSQMLHRSFIDLQLPGWCGYHPPVNTLQYHVDC